MLDEITETIARLRLAVLMARDRWCAEPQVRVPQHLLEKVLNALEEAREQPSNKPPPQDEPNLETLKWEIASLRGERDNALARAKVAEDLLVNESRCFRFLLAEWFRDVADLDDLQRLEIKVRLLPSECIEVARILEDEGTVGHCSINGGDSERSV